MDNPPRKPVEAGHRATTRAQGNQRRDMAVPSGSQGTAGDGLASTEQQCDLAGTRPAIVA